MHLSVIIPAYNEEKRLPKTLLEVDKYLKIQPFDYEIIVVSDGSKDKTGEVVKALLPRISYLRLIDNKENHGKGFVVRQGMLEAEGDYRVFMDADNSTSIDQIEKLMPFAKQGFEIVIGSRDAQGAKLAKAQPIYRRILGEGFNLYVHFMIGLWKIKDTQCGFKMLTAKATKDILPNCKIDRWAFDPEILVVGKRLGYKIKEAPITWVNDVESKVKVSGMIKMATDLLKIKGNLIAGKYPKK